MHHRAVEIIHDGDVFLRLVQLEVVDRGDRVFLTVDDALAHGHHQFAEIDRLHVAAQGLDCRLIGHRRRRADFQALDVVRREDRALGVGDLAEAPFPGGEHHRADLFHFRRGPGLERAVEHPIHVFVAVDREGDGHGVEQLDVLGDLILSRERHVDDALQHLFENLGRAAEHVVRIDRDFDFAVCPLLDVFRELFGRRVRGVRLGPEVRQFEVHARGKSGATHGERCGDGENSQFFHCDALRSINDGTTFQIVTQGLSGLSRPAQIELRKGS